MSVWIVHPIDPLVFGDGRPFTSIPGGALRSRPLPPPPAVAGVVRTRLGKAKGGFKDDGARAQEVKAIDVHGPVVALLAEEGHVEAWLFPRPRDAVVVGDTLDTATLRGLTPRAWPPDASGSELDLAPLDCGAPLGKPPVALRAFWRLETELIPWLSDPRPLRLPPELGVDGPLPDRRVHVAIDPQTGAAKHGALFSVEGRAWLTQLKGADGVERVRRLAFGVSVPKHAALDEALHPIGGERRLAGWRAFDPNAPKSEHSPRKADADWPTLPGELLASLLKKHPAKGASGPLTRGLRVILATPACFDGGERPKPEAPFGLPGARLVAVANDRAEVISGWDLAARRPKPSAQTPDQHETGAPKPTRRLVPAGSVYFLDTAKVDDGTLKTWLTDTWLTPVSEPDDARRDGLGLALFGAWDGHLTPFTP